MPKVSVIIPNYNHAEFLEKRILSILNQTYQDFEVIYLDDASTDNSNEVFTKFADNPRIRAIYNQTNSGSPFKQWNKGIKYANGEYIWIAESDDYADPKFLETLVPILEENPQVGLAYCQSCQTDKHGNITTTMHWWTDDLSKERWKSDFLNSGLDECKRYLVIKNTIPNASAVLTRRCLFEKIAYAEESMILCGDWITWIKILLKSDIAFTAKLLNYYRSHSSSVRSKSSLNGLDIYEKMQIFYFVKENIEIPGQISNEIKNKLTFQWLTLMSMKQKNISMKRIYEFYKFSKICDPYIEFRLLKQLIYFAFSKANRKIQAYF
jgi:glycosyltransferase involved in cell wall biosynthesis